MVGAVCYGIIFGTLFRSSRKGNALALVIYAGLAMSLFSQGYGPETLALEFSGNLKYVLATVAVFYLSRKQMSPVSS